MIRGEKPAILMNADGLGIFEAPIKIEFLGIIAGIDAAQIVSHEEAAAPVVAPPATDRKEKLRDQLNH